MDKKTNCLTTSPQFYQLICTMKEWEDLGLGELNEDKPIRIGEVGTHMQDRVYSVKGKTVTIKSGGGGGGANTGLYRVDLPDGDYVVRKLTPLECERLQTLPDNYTEGVSNTQRIRQIGNGWTVDVIAHILSFLKKEVANEH